MAIKDFSEVVNSLKPLESFDPEVFVGSEKYPQKFCDLILTLSLIWNDFKNLNIYLEISNSHDESEKKITPRAGECGGHDTYLLRMQMALIHEFFIVLNKNKPLINSQLFVNMYRGLPKGIRSSWDTIRKFLDDRVNPETDFGKALLRVRHKIASHYDTKEIGKSYKKRFIENPEIPYISRGSFSLQQRFYFADAVAQQYFLNFTDGDAKGFRDNYNMVRITLNDAIKFVVEKFIQERSAWRKVRKGQ